MIKNIFLFLLLFFNTASSNIVTYEQIINETFNNNLELKIISSNKKIIQADIDLLKTQYYPIISLSLNTQYNKNLQKSNSIFANLSDDETQYSSSSTLKMDYDLYDFGSKNKNILISKINKKLIAPQIKEKKQELKLKLLNIYGELLKDQETIDQYKKIIKINKQIYLLKKRLYQADEIDKTEVSSQSIIIVDLDVNMQNIKNKIKNNINLISFYTHKQYTNSTKFKLYNLTKKDTINYEDSFVKQRFNLLIKQKNKELELLNIQQYPSIKLFSTYTLNDDDETKIDNSFDLIEKNYVIGVEVNINLFEGFKYSANKNKILAQLHKLKLENEEQKELFYKNKYILNKNITDINNNTEKLIISKKENKYKFNMIKKLHETKNITSIVMLENQITMINKKLELKISKIEKTIKLKEMNIYGFNNINEKIIEEKKFKKPIKNKNLFIILSKTANIRNTPYLTGDIVDILNYKDIIDIEYCNEFNWCKVRNKKQFIAKFLIGQIFSNH